MLPVGPRSSWGEPACGRGSGGIAEGEVRAGGEAYGLAAAAATAALPSPARKQPTGVDSAMVPASASLASLALLVVSRSLIHR